MARKYSVDMSATTLTDITGGGADAGTYFLKLCKRTAGDTAFRVAVTSGGAVGNADYVEYDEVLEGKAASYELWPITLGQGWKVFVYTDTTGVSATLNGREE